MNLNPFKSIFNFNKEAGLLEAGYSDERECAFPIEEALEGFDIGNISPKDYSRSLMRGILDDDNPIPDVDRLDKHLDIIVFSLGSIYKLGLTPQQAMKALGVVATKNLEKLHAGQDTHGKQRKPDGFVGPEEQLQKILGERN